MAIQQRRPGLVPVTQMPGAQAGQQLPTASPTPTPASSGGVPPLPSFGGGMPMLGKTAGTQIAGAPSPMTSVSAGGGRGGGPGTVNTGNTSLGPRGNAAVQSLGIGSMGNAVKYGPGNAPSAGRAGVPGAGAAAGFGTAGANSNPAGSDTPATDAAGPQDELDQLYNDIYKEHQDSWAGTEQGINAQTQMNQRRAAEVNAMMGRSIGGGFEGIMAQAQLNGKQQMLGARQTWENRGRQLQLGQLDRKLQEKHRIEDLEKESQGATGSMEDPMDFSGAPPGTTFSQYVGKNADGTVSVRGSDGKYYKLSAAEYEQRTGNNPSTGTSNAPPATMSTVGPREGGGSMSGEQAVSNLIGYLDRSGIDISKVDRGALSRYMLDYYQRNKRWPSLETVKNSTDIF